MLITNNAGKGKKKGRHAVVLVKKTPSPYRVRRFFVFGESSAKFWISVRTFGQKTPSHFRLKFRIILDFSAHALSDKNTIAFWPLLCKKWSKKRIRAAVVGRRILTAQEPFFLVKNIRYQAATEMSIGREKGEWMGSKKIKRKGK